MRKICYFIIRTAKIFPFTWNLLIRKVYLPVYLYANNITWGKGTRFIGKPLVLYAKGGTIIFGKNCYVVSKHLKNLLTTRCRFILMNPGAIIKVGDKVGISGTTIFSTKSITIGDNTLIGSDTTIIDSDYHTIDPWERLKDRNKGVSKDVVIGENVFIGAQTFIMKGTVIGDGSVISAGSVVSGKFEPYSLIVGNPAKKLKTFVKPKLHSE